MKSSHPKTGECKMLSEKLKSLMAKAEENNIEKQKLRESILEKMKELEEAGKKINAEIVEDFIMNYKGSDEEVALMIDYNSAVRNPEAIYSFAVEKMKEMGFFIEGYNQQTMQRGIHINLSEKEQVKKALANLPQMFRVIKPVEFNNGKEKRLVKVITLKVSMDWCLENINNVYMVLGEKNYEIMMSSYSRLTTLFSSEDPEELIFEQLIPYLNENCQYDEEEQD